MNIFSKGLKALITLYQVIIHLVLIVVGSSVGMLMSLIILLTFGNKVADDFLDDYLDLILTIGVDSKDE